MKTLRRILAIVGVLLMFAGCGTTGPESSLGSNPTKAVAQKPTIPPGLSTEGRYIVTFRSDAVGASARAEHQPSSVYRHGFAGKLTPAQVADLRADPSVIAVEPDLIVSADGKNSGPSVDFSATPTTGMSPLSVKLTGKCATAVTWSWDFNSDGIPDSDVKTPTHVFTVGNHSITLTVTDSLGRLGSKTRQDYIKVQGPPVASFRLDAGSSGYAPFQEMYADTSEGGPFTKWVWDFGDGTGATYTQITTPTHLYSVPGNFVVKLTVYNKWGSNTAQQTVSVLAHPPLVADFSADLLSGNPGMVVHFHNDSTGEVAHTYWDFDNNGTIDQTDPNPYKVYSGYGYYSVRLTVVDAAGNTNSKVKINYIAVGVQALGWGVNRIDADLNNRWIDHTAGEGVTVAVIDTGIDLTHPDLEGAIRGGYDATGIGSFNDDHGHGTHVAGIIGARDNGIGCVGVAPQCKLLAVKVLSASGSGYLSWVIAGIDWATAHQAEYDIREINMSLGAQGSSVALQTAINAAAAAGIHVVVAAGNSGMDAAGFIPASCDNVICVSALTSNDEFAPYSNWGSKIDLAAPGSAVPSLYKNGGYATLSGTSMASPHVAGVLALWLDDHTGTPAEALAALIAAGLPGPWAGDTDGISEPMVYARDL